MFDEPLRLVLGLVTGIVFGFLLQKGRVAKHDVIINAFRVKDLTAAKIMGIAGAVGSIGVYALVEGGLANLHVKEAQIGAMVVGGVLFGLGIVVYGYCPGTGVAAVGEGHKDALVGMLGMLGGAALYVVSFPLIEGLRKNFPDLGKMTFPQLTHSSPWPWVLGYACLVGIISYFALTKNRRVASV